MTAGPESSLRHFLQHVLAADGFDDFFFGVLAFVFIVALGGDVRTFRADLRAMDGMLAVVVVRGDQLAMLVIITMRVRVLGVVMV